MWQYNIAINKYWVNQSGYFRLATTVALVMGIKYGKLLFYHLISEQSKDKNISMREYNDRTVYDCFNSPFSVDCGRSALNVPPIPIDDSPRLNKRYWYTSDPLPDAISVASRNSISMLTTSSYSPKILETNYNDPNTQRTITSDNPCRGRTGRGYCSRFHYGKH